MMGRCDTCNIYHHLDWHGSSLLGTKVKHFALLGFNKKAQPVLINTATLFNVKDKSVPGATYVHNLDTKAVVDTVPPSSGKSTMTCTIVTLHSSFLLPPWLTKTIVEAGASTFTNIFLAICEAVHDLDRLEDTTAEPQDNGNPPPSSTAHHNILLPLLQALSWCQNWAVNLINGYVKYDAACHPDQTTVTSRWVDDIHLCFLSKPQTSPTLAPINMLAMEAIMLSHSIDQPNDTCTSSLTSSLSSLKKGAHKLLSKIKTMLLHTAS
eukprot:9486240-Ditylum_brightwellii.AAC.1